MSINAIIQAALAPLGIPVEQDFYGGGKTEYATFNYANDASPLYGDEEPLAVVVSMQIHWFLPADKNYLATKRKIRNALFKAGFTYPEVTEIIEKSVSKGDKDIRHVVFECEIEDEDALKELSEE